LVEPNRVDPNLVEANRVAPNFVAPNLVAPSFVEPNFVDANWLTPGLVTMAFFVAMRLLISDFFSMDICLLLFFRLPTDVWLYCTGIAKLVGLYPAHDTTKNQQLTDKTKILYQAVEGKLLALGK
jgi:hypothetical protein